MTTKKSAQTAHTSRLTKAAEIAAIRIAGKITDALYRLEAVDGPTARELDEAGALLREARSLVLGVSK